MTNLTAVTFAVIGVLLNSTSQAAGQPSTAAPKPIPEREVIADGLRSPWAIAFIDANNALVTEKEGGLLRIDLRNRETVQISGMPVDIVDDIRSTSVADNGGLFDVVLHPKFASNDLLYLSYAAKTADGRTTKVIRGRLDGDTLVEVATILTATPYTPDEFFHYGGGMVFGRDGKLYVTIGERLFRESDGPDFPIAQDTSDRRGKIFRLNDDGSIPDDNPDFGEGAIPGLFAIGIRAAQGLTGHPETGELWFSEHGSRQGDEINRLRAGANYGWPIKTRGGYRDEDYNPPQNISGPFTYPVFGWRETAAPTGLTFYFGDDFPSWKGDLLVAGLSVGGLYRLDFEGGEVIAVEELFANARIRSRDVAVSPDGKLYQLTDTLLVADDNGQLQFKGEPGGALVRIRPSGKTP